MIRNKNTQIFLLALAAAWLLASTQILRPENWPLVGLYIYWTVRILLEAGLFVAFLELFGRLPALRDKFWLTAAIAAFVSLVPFALAVTALDLILGLPELGELVASGTAGSTSTGKTHIGSFLLELIYLSDNHLVLCFLLSVPLVFQSVSPSMKRDIGSRASEISKPVASSIDGAVQLTSPLPSGQQWEKGYQRHLEVPLQAPVLRVDAQEHYVRLTTARETRMVLYRFNDIVAELSVSDGMQVHRSHWVAFEAMERIVREEGRTWLELSEGAKVPVSRKYVEDVRKVISARTSETSKAVN